MIPRIGNLDWNQLCCSPTDLTWAYSPGQQTDNLSGIKQSVMVSFHICHWQVSSSCLSLLPLLSRNLAQICSHGESKNVRQEVAGIWSPGCKRIQHPLPCLLLVKASYFKCKWYGDLHGRNKESVTICNLL